MGVIFIGSSLVAFLLYGAPLIKATHQYDCDPIFNFQYAGFNKGPDLDAEGLVDIKKLDEMQMRVLRPTQLKGGCADGDDYAFLVR